MADIIAERYAGALFEVAEESNLRDRTLQDAKRLQTALDESEELVRFLNLPDITWESKLKAVKELCWDELEEPMRGLVSVVLRKGRADYLSDILDAYEALVMEAEKTITARVTTAKALSEAQAEKIRTTLEKALDKKVILDMQIDASLIGGIVVRVKDTVYDNSIRSSLKRMTKHLTEVRLTDQEVV